MTRIEYDVLEYLATHLSRVCTREEMVLAIWSSALTHDHPLVDVPVANLRGKLRRIIAGAEQPDRRQRCRACFLHITNVSARSRGTRSGKK